MLVDGMRGLAPFSDRPDDKRLTAAHIAASEDLVERAFVGPCVGRDIAALIETHPELLDHAVMDRRDEAHRQQHEIGLKLKLRIRNRLHLAVDSYADEFLDEAVLAQKFARKHGE